MGTSVAADGAIVNGAVPVPDELFTLTHTQTGLKTPLRKADDAVLAECLAGFTASCNAANQQLMQAMNNFAQAAQLKAVVEFEIERRRKQLLVLPTH